MAINVLFAGIPVADLDAAIDWYERLFGEPPFMRPHDTESAWQLEEHAWVYVVQDGERAGRGLLTVLVDDLDAQLASLAERATSSAAESSFPPGMTKWGGRSTWFM